MTSFIESPLFPVSRLSKESYKERKAGSGQTLTGLGKWWGRKPLVLVRATIIGLLLESSEKGSQQDLDIFLALMTMDEEGLLARYSKSISAKDAAPYFSQEEKARYLVSKGEGKWGWDRATRKEGQAAAFQHLGYDDKLKYCDRPEQIDGPSEAAWKKINAHCGTTAKTLQEWVEQRGQALFGHTPRVGDAFCGGGSIPFEAARLGCEAYGSDLNPVAALLTWAALNIVGGGPEVQERVRAAQEEAFAKTDEQITAWGIEHNEQGWRADAYLYCVEARSPATGYLVPLAPNWIISEKYKVCGVLEPDHANKRYHLRIVTGADAATFKAARTGTVQRSRLVCPETNQTWPMDEIRGDQRIDGETRYGLRQWENEDLVPRSDDVFQERLYCIRYLDLTCNRHYIEPTDQDLAREDKVLSLMQERFTAWQEKGYIPSMKIARGYNTDQPIRERGWTHWHHLFTPRQLLFGGLFGTKVLGKKDQIVANILQQGVIANLNSRLIRWRSSMTRSGGIGSAGDTFSNQALNTIYNPPNRASITHNNLPLISEGYNVGKKVYPGVITCEDSRLLKVDSDFWITDPPYGDAINYHELADFFLSWMQKGISKEFLDWPKSSKSALAVKGTGQSFNESMVEVYSNLAKHMPDDGAQVVMFTHQDASVWADLALILWASGLRVTAAWTIQTETDSAGLKTGNYVQGTVLMVLRKQKSKEEGFLTDIQPEVELEVKRQIDAMRRLDDKEQPNFGDADYQLAAYAAALRVLTGYSKIGDIDIQRELARGKRDESEVESVIESAVRVAMDYLVPTEFDDANWLKLQAFERFYLKGLEVEQGGEYRNGVYTEMARGFGLREYNHLLESGKSNQTRLKTATEFKNREKDEVGTLSFGGSLTRYLLLAAYITGQKENDPKAGRNYLYAELPDYWGTRKLLLSIGEYILAKTGELEQWQLDREALELLIEFVRMEGV